MPSEVNRRDLLCVVSRLAFTGALIFTGNAYAQVPTEVGSPPASEQPQSGGLESGDIVVTAQRRSQNLQKVPLSVTAISSTIIQNLNIRTIDKVQTVTPGLIFGTGYTFPQVYIRGIGVTTVNPGLEGPVATYVDGVYVPRALGTLFELIDTGSVEVLKGPQGTLYGRNATGGAILINTANPTHEFSLNGQIEYGRFDHVKAEAAVNLPASETLAFRFAAAKMYDRGFVTNIATGNKVRGRRGYTLRGKAKWDPTPDLDAMLTLEYLHTNSRSVGAGREVAAAPFCLACTRGSTIAPGFFQVNEDVEGMQPTKSYGGNLRLQYNAGPIKIQSITAYRYLTAYNASDGDHSELPLFQFQSLWGGKTFSEDIQITSDFGGIFNFLAGSQFINDRAFGSNNISGQLFGIPYTAPRAQTDQKVRTNSYAAFAELYIKPVARLTITLGGRYSRDERRLVSVVSPVGVAVQNPGGPTNFTQKVGYTKFTPRAVIAYDADIVNLYASFTQGFKAGGFNLPSFKPQVVPIRPENIDSYEIGAKFVSPDRRVRLNISAFRYDYKNVQVGTLDILRGGKIVTNAAKARGKGAEAELSYRPVDWLNFSAGGAYLDAKFRSYPNASVFVIRRSPLGVPLGYATGFADISGRSLPNSPKWSAFLATDIQTPLGGDLIGRLGGVIRYTSDYDFLPAAGGESRADRQRSLTLINLSGGIGPSSRAYEIGFYVDNLTNKKYFDLIATGTFGIDTYAAKPRAIGARIKFQL